MSPVSVLGAGEDLTEPCAGDSGTQLEDRERVNGDTDQQQSNSKSGGGMEMLNMSRILG